MTALDWVAAGVLGVEWPIPVFWLVLHPIIGFWRRRPQLAYWTAGLLAWVPGIALLYLLRDWLFVAGQASAPKIVIGFVLLAVDAAVLVRVQRELGPQRLVGRAELAGAGGLYTRGLYARVRHPRYTAMMAGVLGACLMAGSLLMWVLSAAWWMLALLATMFEERELRARFGIGYAEYCRRVPRFLPFRLWPQEH